MGMGAKPSESKDASSRRDEHGTKSGWTAQQCVSKSAETHGTPTSGATHKIESRGCRTTPPVPGALRAHELLHVGVDGHPPCCLHAHALSPPAPIQYWCRNTPHLSGLLLAPGCQVLFPKPKKLSPDLPPIECVVYDRKRRGGLSIEQHPRDFSTELRTRCIKNPVTTSMTRSSTNVIHRSGL